ncbi:MAG: ADOP family duplicated permease [Longimicrobiales bacterium]
MEPRPPRWARLVLRLVCDPDTRPAQLGDLQEEFADRHDADPRSARRWYRRQVRGSLLPNLRVRAERAWRRTRTPAGDGLMRTLFQDVRFAFRAARSHLGVSTVVVLTLALGIGANTTIFSVVHGLVLNPFPFPEPDRVVGVGSYHPRLGGSLSFFENLSPAEYEDIRDRSRTLEDVVAWDMGNRQLTGPEGIPDNVRTGFFYGDALRTLGMDAHLGRGFSDDEIAERTAVAILSYDLWRDRYGADSTLVGRALRVNDYPFTVVGVLPEGVDLYGMQLWTLMAVGPERYPRNRRQFQVMGRVRADASLTEVNAELETLAGQVAQAYSGEFEEYEGWVLEARTWTHIGTQLYRTGAFIVMGAVAFVLLLVCANTANLLLARAQGRRREMAVRTAMGAGRGRLVGQLLTESVVLAALGGLLGVGLAWLGVAGLDRLVTNLGLPVSGTLSMNGPVLAFTAAVAVLAGVLFGLAPAFQASRTDIAATLQSEGKASTSGINRQRLQRTLVAVEVALAFVLLAGGGLLVNSFVRLNAVAPGFAHENVLTMRLTLPREQYEGQAVPAFFEELTQRLEAVPGVRSAGAGTQFPPVAFAFRELWFEGTDDSPDATLPVALTTVVTPGYFEALGIPIRRGRSFGDADRAGAPLVGVINEVAAERFMPGEDPIGRRLKLGGPDAEAPAFEIVGVVGSTRNRGLDQEPFPEVFAVHDQIGGSQNQLFLVLRTDVDPRSVLPAVRDAVREMDADQPVYAIATVAEAFAQASTTRRVTTLLLSCLGVFALLLAAVGIYSVVSYTVSDRTQEIGVRVALGADAGRVRRLVVRQALLPVVVGAGVGVGLAVPLGMGLRQLLFEVSGTDPLTLGATAVLLVGVAAAASWVPAWRASRLDPVEALRQE